MFKHVKYFLDLDFFVGYSWKPFLHVLLFWVKFDLYFGKIISVSPEKSNRRLLWVMGNLETVKSVHGHAFLEFFFFCVHCDKRAAHLRVKKSTCQRSAYYQPTDSLMLI